MSNVSYSIVCEDAAHYFFVKRLLDIYGFNKRTFLINEECYIRYKCATKKDVLNRYESIANQAFRQFPIQLLIILVDHDDRPKETFTEYHKELSEPIFADIKDKVVIAISVRCIEHWLRYLQWKEANPDSTKNESMEGENRTDSKLVVYGSKKPSKDKTEAVVNDLLKAENVTWLTSRSASFNHFYQELTSFSTR